MPELYKAWLLNKQYEEMNIVSDTGGRMTTNAPRWEPFDKKASDKGQSIKNLAQKRVVTNDDKEENEPDEFQLQRLEMLETVESEKKVFASLKESGNGDNQSGPNIKVAHQTRGGGRPKRERGGRQRRERENNDSQYMASNAGSSMAAALVDALPGLSLEDAYIEPEVHNAPEANFRGNQYNGNQSRGRGHSGNTRGRGRPQTAPDNRNSDRGGRGSRGRGGRGRGGQRGGFTGCD